MQISNILLWTMASCSLSLYAVTMQNGTEQKILVLTDEFDIKQIDVQDSKFSLSDDKDVKALRIVTGKSAQWPGVALKAPKGNWELSNYEYISLDIKNVGSNNVKVFCRVDNPGADGIKNCITGDISLKQREKKTLKIKLLRNLPESFKNKLFGMRGYPGGLVKEKGIDAENITQLVIFVSKPSEEHIFEISNIRADGSYSSPEWLSMQESEFFPIIDEYGQFIHKSWHNKTTSNSELEKRKQEEAKELEQLPGPEDWDVYGGWKSGPQLTQTGYFRVEKYKGKWWLVDPEGRLFWSHGIDCVNRTNGTTPITDRKYLYKNLPSSDSELAKFYGKGSWAPHGYYKEKNYETYNFTGANLLRKYDENWYQKSAEISHRRLRSWGMNTIANWSDESIYLMRKTPYVVSINFGGKKLEGSEGYWGKFRDVFDASFQEALKQRMSGEKGKSAGDPWCIGYFVDNEISWGDEVSLAIAALLSPPEQQAKKVFVESLKNKYQTIDNLNKSWGAQYSSWEALMNSRQEPNRKKAYDDLVAFYTQTANMYFKTCREAVKEVAPNQLYLGCRFAWANSKAVEAAAKYCDVVSYNLYRREIKDFRLPEDIDKPVIVGEFHFGALDRGMFHTGLVPTANQEERAEAYKNYVLGALQNPHFVGTHWFQYGDQATTGRGDGENYQIGFLDVVDTPYAETIRACRDVGYNMYEYRVNFP